jgi:hypothetical protein
MSDLEGFTASSCLSASVKSFGRRQASSDRTQQCRLFFQPVLPHEVSYAGSTVVFAVDMMSLHDGFHGTALPL